MPNQMDSDYSPQYFSERELNKLVPSCSLTDMDERFMKRLDFARTIAGIPFVLNCAYRSKEWDASKGRKYFNQYGCSYHSLGRAVDIHCNNSDNRRRIIYSCLNAGFKGIGIYKTFIHVDDRYRDDTETGIIFIGDE